MSVLAAGRRQCSVNLRYGVATAAAEAAAPSVASRRPHALLERHAACNGSLGLISTDRAPAVSKQCLPHRPADWPGTAPRRSCGRNDDGQRATSPPPARHPTGVSQSRPARPGQTRYRKRSIRHAARRAPAGRRHSGWSSRRRHCRPPRFYQGWRTSPRGGGVVVDARYGCTERRTQIIQARCRSPTAPIRDAGKNVAITSHHDAAATAEITYKPIRDLQVTSRARQL